MKKMYKILALLSVIVFGMNPGSFAQTYTFSYTGSVQTFIVPAGVDSIKISVKGATGGLNSSPIAHADRPGYGGCAQATYTVTPGQVMYVYVGGQGANGVTGTLSAGGFNGGAAGQFLAGSFAGGGGGGASDVRLGSTALGSRIIVAGGGGGAGLSTCTSPSQQERGGDGGAFTGETGLATCIALSPGVGGGGGNTTLGTGGGGGSCGSGCAGSPGSAGTSGAGGNAGAGSPGGGGGGGYYGGGGGQYTGGGGGSNYFAPSSFLTTVNTRGCNSTGDGLITMTAHCIPSTVTATSTVICAGNTLTVSDNIPGGTWSSNNTSIATVGTSSGIVTGVSGGTAIISYNVGPCFATITVTINPVPTAIAGNPSVCFGMTSAFSDSDPGGTWSLTGVGSIDAFGVVTGSTLGTATVTYTFTTTGCFSTLPITVNPLPANITGPVQVCVGLTTTLSDATSGGTWSNFDPTPLTSIGAGSGVVTGLAAGVDTIYYTLTATGCKASVAYTVNPLPAAIAGNLEVCKAAITTLSDASGPGTWTSGNTSVATVNSSTGDVTGVLSGTATITYTITSTGCLITDMVTVNPLPTVYPMSVGGHYCAGDAGIDIQLFDSDFGIKYDLYNSVTGWVASLVGAGGGAPVDFGLQTGAGTYTILATDTSKSTRCTSLASSATIVIDPLPTITGSTFTVCAGSSTLLGGITTGGTWSSSNTSVATISSGGVLAGVPSSVGTATITYTLGTSCFTTQVATVNPNFPIYGITTVCYGSTITLFDTTDGGAGVWSSTGVAIASGSGTTQSVTASSSGTGSVKYTSALGCSATTTVTFSPLDPITGPDQVCEGLTIALSNINGGGTWTSSTTTIATVNTTGTVTAVLAGVDTIFYTLGTGCQALYVITVNPLPAPITGSHTVCYGLTTTLSDATGGGGWTSTSGGAIASVDPFTGTVTGTTVGTDQVTFTLSATGCIATYTFTVNPRPSKISGITTICQGFASQLSDAFGGGTWISTNTAIATVGSSSGLVTDVSLSGGITNIIYTLPTGCDTSILFTVNPTPAVITGIDTLCGGGTVTLSDASAGSWSSQTTTIATIGVLSGVVTATSIGGIDSIFFTSPVGCVRSQAIYVYTLSPIGPLSPSVCVGSTLTLSDLGTGGTWISSNTAVGTIDPVTGTVTGIIAGSTTITDTFASGCFATTILTVNPLPGAITGSSSLCVGSTITLSDGGGGTWSTSATIASVTSGGVVSGINPGGTATITFTLPTGCFATKTVTVNPISPITSSTGSFAICQGDGLTLSDATGGGTWSSSSTTTAQVGSSSGVVTTSAPPPIIGGTVVMTYTTAAGCTATKTMTVNTVQPISGPVPAQVCVGSTVTFSDATAGGTWSTTSTCLSISSGGVVTGIAIPAGVITYTSPSGCETVLFVAVNPLPTAILGALEICQGTTTTLSDATAGGTWSSSNTSIATIGSSTGLTTGVLGGTATITYKLTLTGCFITATMVVDPVAPITGTTSTCIGLTTSLTDAIGGGTWSSSSTVASINSSGIVTGVSPGGTATITYTNPKGCTSLTTVTIFALPSAIAGNFTLCQGQTTLLSDAVGGGTWMSSNTTIATIPSGGFILTGVLGYGTSTITYTLGTGCYAVQTVTVNAITPITGPTRVCMGSSITMGDATGGGTWTSGTTSVADITPGPGVGGGVITTNSVGTTVITYTLGTGCTATVIVTVNPLPNAITGTDVLCSGSSVTLSDSPIGGAWTSQNTLIATVTSPGGIVTGVGAGGVTNITYTLPTSCFAIYNVTVNPLPAPITGLLDICLGTSTTLSDATAGGIWSSINTAVATIGSSSGVVSSGGITLGTSTISYTLTSTGCAATKVVTVSPFPTGITGPTQVCVASSITMSDALSGGAWSTSPVTVATITPVGGVLTGVSGGTVTVDYTTPSGCNALYTVTVLPQPPAIITPLSDTNICPGGFVALTANTGTLLSYQWYNAAGPTIIPGATASSYIAAPSVNTSYQVLITAGTTGCSLMSSPMLVSIIPTTASITSSPPSGTVCAGTPITLTASGTAPTGYQWEMGGVPISGATAVTYTPTVNGTYDVVVTNATGCSAKATAIVIKINPSPLGTVTVTGALTFCKGDSVIMTGEAGSGYTYQWYNGATLLSGETNITYVAKTSGSYKVVEANSFGCTATSGTTVVVANLPPTGLGILNSGSLVFCVGSLGATLSAVPGSAGPGATFQWYKNGSPIFGSTGSSIIVTTGGIFKALVTDPVTGCSAFTPADTTLLVTQPLVLPLSSASFCWGGSAMLKASIVSGITPTYQWYLNSTAIPGATNNVYNATISGSYMVKIVSACAISSTALSVTENPLPNPLIKFDGTTFTTQSNFVSYQWFKNLVAIPGATSYSVKASTNGNYKVQVTDTMGCQSFSDIFVLTGWTPNGGFNNGVPNLAKGEVRIYPNPAQTMVHIASADEVRAVITSIDGRMLIEQNNARDIDITRLADGIYTIMIYDVNGQMVKAEKLVKSTE